MEAVKHSRMSSQTENGPLAESEMKFAAGLLARAVSHGQQKPLTQLIGKLIQNKGVAASSQAFLAGVTTEVVGAMADSSKRQRDFDDESSWGVLTNPSEAGSPGQIIRAGYLPEMYHPSDTVYESGPMPGLGTMLDGPVNFLTPNGEDLHHCHLALRMSWSGLALRSNCPSWLAAIGHTKTLCSMLPRTMT